MLIQISNPGFNSTIVDFCWKWASLYDHVLILLGRLAQLG